MNGQGVRCRPTGHPRQLGPAQASKPALGCRVCAQVRLPWGTPPPGGGEGPRRCHLALKQGSRHLCADRRGQCPQGEQPPHLAVPVRYREDSGTRARQRPRLLSAPCPDSGTAACWEVPAVHTVLQLPRPFAAQTPRGHSHPFLCPKKLRPAERRAQSRASSQGAGPLQGAPGPNLVSKAGHGTRAGTSASRQHPPGQTPTHLPFPRSRQVGTRGALSHLGEWLRGRQSQEPGPPPRHASSALSPAPRGDRGL